MGKDYKILEATEQHAKLLKIIYKESRNQLGSFNLYQCWDKYLLGENNESFDVLVLKLPHSYMPVGFVRWNYSMKYQSNLIKDIGVLNSVRGLGHGSILLRHVPLPIVLKCNADNFEGNRFYKMKGMKKAGTTQTRNGRPQIIWTCAEW